MDAKKRCKHANGLSDTVANLQNLAICCNQSSTCRRRRWTVCTLSKSTLAPLQMWSSMRLHFSQSASLRKCVFTLCTRFGVADVSSCLPFFLLVPSSHFVSSRFLPRLQMSAREVAHGGCSSRGRCLFCNILNFRVVNQSFCKRLSRNFRAWSQLFRLWCRWSVLTSE